MENGISSSIVFQVFRNQQNRMLSDKVIKMKPKTVLKIDENESNKKMYFGDDGQVVDKPVVKKKIEKTPKVAANVEAEEESTEISTVKPKKGFKKYQQNVEDIETKWYQFHEEHNTNEFKDIKDSELNTLQQLCRTSFNEEIQKQTKSK